MMTSAGRLTLLAVLFALVAAMQTRLTWSTLEFAWHPETVHARPPLSDRLVANADARGTLRKGDRVVEVNGVPVTTRWQVQQQVIRLPVGAAVPMTVERGGQRVTVESISWAWSIGWAERAYTVMQNVVTPWFAIVLGFFIVWRRPQDRMAWLVLFILLGLAQFYSYLFQTDAWGAVIAGLLRFLMPLLLRLGAVAWLWFALDFGAGRRLLPWLRWPITLVLGWVSVQTAFAGLAGLHFPGWLDLLDRGEMPRPVHVTATLAALVLGFANLVFRMWGETEPDARRRLRLLVTGMVLGRGPAFVLEVAGLFGWPLASWPLAVWATAIAAVFLVPVTFAYVLIVERAMDVGVVVRQGLQYAFARRSVDGLRIALALAPLIFVESRWQAIAWSLLALLLVGPVAERLRRWIDRRFFREAVQAEQVLAGLAEPLRAVTEPRAVLATVAERVAAVLHVTQVQSWLAEDGPAPDWLNAAAADSLALPIAGHNALLGALHLGPKKSQEPYSSSERQLLQSASHQAALALENARLTRAVADEAAQRERIQRELEIARDVQARLLPKREPVLEGLAVAGLCRPAQSIGGDSYDYLAAGDGRLLITIADVAGKGVPAALLMSNLQAGLRGLTLNGAATNLAEVLAQVNVLAYDSTPANRFITLFALLCDGRRRELHYSSAGHNPAALLRATADRVEWLRTKGVALGLRRTSEFTEASLTLAPGDVLVLYTDGVTEAVAASGEEFGEERLEQAIVAGRALAPAALRDAVVQAVDGFAAGAPQHDDITLVVLRVA